MRWTAPIRANGPPRRLASTGTCSVGFRPVLSHCPLHCPLTHAPSAHPSSACTARPRRSTALPDRPASDAAADPPAPPCAVAARERRTRLPPPSLSLSLTPSLSLSTRTTNGHVPASLHSPRLHFRAPLLARIASGPLETGPRDCASDGSIRRGAFNSTAPAADACRNGPHKRRRRVIDFSNGAGAGQKN